MDLGSAAITTSESPPRPEFTASLLAIVSVLLPINIALWWIAAYFGELFPEAISFLVADGHCDDDISGIGAHCFGDFVAPVKEAQEGVFFIANSAPANLLYDMLAAFLGDQPPPRVLVISYLTICFIALSIPAVQVVRQSYSHLTKASLLCGPFTLPALAILDRGNNFALAIPLLMIFSIAFLRGNYKHSVYLLVSVSVFKPHLLALLILLLVSRRYKTAVKGLFLGALLHMGAALWYDNNFLSATMRYFTQLSEYGDRYVSLDNQLVSNFSIAKGIHSSLILVNEVRLASITELIERFPTTIGLFVLLVVSLLAFEYGKTLNRFEQLTIFLPLVIMTPGITFAPYLGFSIVLGALVLLDESRFFGWSATEGLVQRSKPVRYSLLLAMALTLLPLSLPVSASDGSKALTTLWLIPLAWILYSLLLLNAAKKTRNQRWNSAK